jgi:outer membrane protein insertion porin family/translocation and assembly module TamA
VVETRQGNLRVEIVVDPGEPVLVDPVERDFPEADRPFALDEARRQVLFDANERIRDRLNAYRDRPREGAEEHPRFDEERYDETKRALLRVLTDGGFAHASVVGRVSVDLVTHRAAVRFVIAAGPPCTFGDVRIEGLGELPDDRVRGALGFAKGQPYSTTALETAHYALADLQVFGSVEIVPARSGRDGRPLTVIPVTVRVEPIKLRSVRLGLGAEVGSQLEAHAVAGWDHRNLFGGLRRFSVETRPGLVLFPMRAETLFTQAPTRVVPQWQLLFDFKQPGLFEARTNLLANAGVAIYAPHVTPVPEPVPADYNILGYREVDGSVGLERTFRLPAVAMSALYGGQFVKLQFDDPFSYNLAAPPDGYERVFVPYLETVLSWDLRKDEQGKPATVEPRSGVYFGVNLQLAGYLAGDADDVRLRPEVRLFAPLGEGVTAAIRWSSGFLFPSSYGGSLSAGAQASEEQRARDLQLLGIRAFFSGGPYSNRGYGYREVGPHEVLPFLSQRGHSDEPLPTGGLGMMELSGELRLALSEKLRAVVFVDTSDVVRTLSDFRFTHPHLSPGVGLRLTTPVGPLRFDLGLRPPYLQRLGYQWLEPEEGGPQPGEEPGWPMSVALAIGEAF